MVLPADLPPTPGDEGAVARLGACMAVLRQATIAELARATDLLEGEVRVGLRQLSDILNSAGMVVLDDGQAVALQPRADLAEMAQRLAARPPHRALSALQCFAMAVAVGRGIVTVAELSDLRQADSWRLVRSLEEKGYLARAGDGYVATHAFLALLRQSGGPETMEELREQLLGQLDERNREILRERFGEVVPVPQESADEVDGG
jgi:chromosome segregation and condensation protein ScpB